MTSPVALVCCSHGTDDPDGQRAVAAFVATVRAARPELEVRETYVDVQHPQVDDVVSTSVAEGYRPVVVPFLLSSGFHVHVDIASAAASSGAIVTPALGPDPRLTQIVGDRLGEAGATEDDVVVLAAAGSSDSRALADVERVAAELRDARGSSVSLAYGSSARPSVPDALAQARAAHPGARIVIASYLLAPGFFHRRLADAGADLVTEPLLPVRDGAPVIDHRLTEIVLDRLDTAMACIHGG